MAHLEKPVGEVHIHNREAEGVASLFPHQLRSTSSTLIELLEDYYTYLNSKDQATNLIDRIQHEHDIDLTDEKYLNEIKKEIAKGVQGSFVLDNRQLFRRIVDYYKTRGTDDSARTFFRLFFDGEASITYPRDYLFKPSSGDLSSFGYIDSDGNRIQYDTTVGSFEQDLPAPSIPVEIDDTQRFGFIRVDGTYETAFWEYDRPKADRKFTIRIEKDELNSPELEEVALNDGQNGLPTFLKHDEKEDIFIDLSYVYPDDKPSIPFRLGVWDAPNTTIYEKNLDTGAISTWRENLSGEGYSEAATDVKQRHLYYSDNLFHLMRTGRNHVMAPLHAAGKYFANTQERGEGDRVIFHFFALEDTRIEFYELPREIPAYQGVPDSPPLVDIYDEYVAGKDFNLVTEDDGTYDVIVLKEVKEIKAGKFATFIGEADTTAGDPSWDRHAFFKSTGNIIGTCNVVDAQTFESDAHILSPMAQKYNGRGIGEANATIVYDISEPDVLNIKRGATGSADNIELEDGQFGVVTYIADGKGGDSTQTIPFGSCKDTYVWGDTLRGFNFKTLYPNNTPGVGIRTYGLVNGEWNRYTYSNNATIVYEDLNEGSNSGNTSDPLLQIGEATPTAWKFESNLPFAVWINDVDAADEETLWSTYNRNTYNQSAYTLYEDYNNRKGFISDINKIHDGNYWQEFSYALNTDVSVDLWKDRYYKLVHPSGLKLFSDLFIERFAERKDREEKPLFDVGTPTWVTDLYGAANQFMTHYQPGWLGVANTAQVVLETLIAAGASAPQIESYLQILSTYKVITNINTADDTVEFELKIQYVYTPTDFVIGDSSNRYYVSGTFESVNDINKPDSTLKQSLRYITWNSSISAASNDTISSWEGLLDITNISDVEIKIGSGPDNFTSGRTLTPDPDNLSIEFPTEDVVYSNI